MKKRLYLIILLLFTFILFGCSVEDSNPSHVDGDQVETETNEPEEQDDQSDVNNNEDQQNNTDNNNEKPKTDQPLNGLTVHYIDANQGDATLFQHEDFTVLYDAGDWKDSNVIDYLEEANIEKIDLIIISHPHADHIGQLEQIINSIQVDEVWMTENVANTKVFQQAVDAILNSDTQFYNPEAGEIFDIGAMELLILHPETLTGNLNEDSLSVRFSYGDVSFVFTGDAYKNEELMILERDLPVEADFLQLGHHGSNTSSDPTFIEAVNPKYAIYSAGKNNQYGHPHAEIVNYFADANIELLGTDVHGTIIVKTDGDTYDVNTKQDGDVTANTNEDHTEQEETTPSETDENEDCININEASIDQLKQITHIGDKRAEELVEHRPYTSIEELTKINGIGDARLADIKEQNLACVN